MKKWQAVMTDTAVNDLREIALGIVEISRDPDTAAGIIEELREKCGILDSGPESGAVPRDYVLKAMGYRFLVHKHYLIFYIIEHKVYIHAVFNEKQDYFRVMRNRI